MLEKTHCKIAEEIAKILNLRKLESKLLLAGSIYPDSDIPFPHHHGRELTIVSNILKAQNLYLKNDDECFHTLGIAFHFIQDRWTLRPRLKEKHTKWESDIDSAEILDSNELRTEITNAALPTKVQNAYQTLLSQIDLGVAGVSKEALENTSRLLTVNFLNLHPSLEGEGFVWVEPTAISTTKDMGGIKQVGQAWCFGQRLSLFYAKEGIEVISYALQAHPMPGWSTPLLDLNFAFRICMQISREFLESKEEWLRID